MTADDVRPRLRPAGEIASAGPGRDAVDLLHGDTAYPAGQPRAGGRLRRRRPDRHAGRATAPTRAFTSIDISADVAGRGEARSARRPG